MLLTPWRRTQILTVRNVRFFSIPSSVNPSLTSNSPRTLFLRTRRWNASQKLTTFNINFGLWFIWEMSGILRNYVEVPDRRSNQIETQYQVPWVSATCLKTTWKFWIAIVPNLQWRIEEFPEMKFNWSRCLGFHAEGYARSYKLFRNYVINELKWKRQTIQMIILLMHKGNILLSKNGGYMR